MKYSREVIRSAYSEASKRYPISEIAKQINVPRHRLYQFGSTGRASTETMQTVEAWLLAHGYLEKEQPVSLAKALAERLRALASILDCDGVSEELKRQEFEGFIKSTASGYLAALREKGLGKR